MDNFNLIINEFIENAKKFYPKIDFGEASRWGNHNSDEGAYHVEFARSSDILFNTEYEYTGSPHLKHYTTLNSLLNILHTNQLRLSQIKSFNDPKELLFIADLLKINFDETEINKIKSNYFASSFSVDNSENFYLWNSYGDKGMGAIIEFELINPSSSVLNSYWGKVQYGENNEAIKLKAFINYIKSFREKHSNCISNEYTDLTKILCLFYKNAIWSYENEVRIIVPYFYDTYSLDESPENNTNLMSSPFYGVNNCGVSYSNIFIPISTPDWYEEKQKNIKQKDNNSELEDVIHILKISKIILGYRMKDYTIFEIERILNNYNKINKTIVSIEMSAFKSKFS